jgi:hypothetical protein
MIVIPAKAGIQGIQRGAIGLLAPGRNTRNSVTAPTSP